MTAFLAPFQTQLGLKVHVLHEKHYNKLYSKSVNCFL